MYRRNRLMGGSYFFTVNLHNRKSGLFLSHVDLLRDAFRATMQRYPFEIDAIVVLPDHLHTLWTLPEGDDDYPNRWRMLKSHFTRALKASGYPLQTNAKGEHFVWQRRYWEHTIRDDNDRQRHVDYIHYNPVKHGHAKKPSDWRYSSFHRYVVRGILPADWGEHMQDASGEFGE
jgi:putative transposase